MTRGGCLHPGMPWRPHLDPTWQTGLNIHTRISAHKHTHKRMVHGKENLYAQTHTRTQTVSTSKFFSFQAGWVPEQMEKSAGDNLPALILQLGHVLSQHFSGKLSSFLSALSNIIPSLSQQLSSSSSPLVSPSRCSRGADTRGGVGEQWGRTDRTRGREEGWGGGGGGGGWEGGIGVCDCQLWERDPPGGVRVQEKRKRE